MIKRYAVFGGAVAVACALSFASVSAYSAPLASLKADSNVVLIKKGDGEGKHGKSWSKGKHDGNKNWSKKGGDKKWSGKGRGGKKWSKHGKWHAGQHYRGGYWRDGIFFALPFVIGNQCYDYLDWRDGAPRPGWYWVC